MHMTMALTKYSEMTGAKSLEAALLRNRRVRKIARPLPRVALRVCRISSGSLVLPLTFLLNILEAWLADVAAHDRSQDMEAPVVVRPVIRVMPSNLVNSTLTGTLKPKHQNRKTRILWIHCNPVPGCRVS